MSDVIPIIEGPDKWCIISSFANRKAVEFKTQKAILSGIVSEIQHEDGSGNSFNMVIRIDSIDCKVYYNTRTKKGSIKRIS